MLKLMKHSRVSKQPLETTMVSNSFPIDKRMKGECTMWNVSNGDTLAFDNQGNNLLQNKLLNPNGDGTLVFFPSLNIGGLALVVWFASLLVQKDRVI